MTSKYMSFASYEQAYAAASLGPISFRCAVCGRGHTLRSGGLLPTSARPCLATVLRPVVQPLAAVYIYKPVQLDASRGFEQIPYAPIIYCAPPPWLQLGLADVPGIHYDCRMSRFSWYPHATLCATPSLDGSMNDLDAISLLMLERSVFIRIMTERRRAQRMEHNIESKFHRKFSCSYPQPGIFSASPHIMGPPVNVTLPLVVDFETRTMSDGNGDVVLSSGDIDNKLIQRYIDALYLNTGSLTDYNLRLNSSNMIGAIFELDKLVIVFRSIVDKGRICRTAAYPVIGYELLVPWRLWHKDIELGDLMTQALRGLASS